jgi:hypothetical protein
MHAYRAGHGSRARVLYFFRTPSNVKVGRRALDPEVREGLEHTHPDLAFDWAGLTREPVLPRFDPRERPERPARPSTGSGRGERVEPRRPPPSVAAPPPEVVPAIIEDDSVLGRTLGGQEAARLRGRYNEMLQRISRRARTPEDRDRLTERAIRLNPDDWADASVVRAAVTAIEAEWDAVVSELPLRRRGRRGGRFRNGGPAEGRSEEGRTEEGRTEEGRTNENQEEHGQATHAERLGHEDPGVDDPRHGGHLGTDAGAAEHPSFADTSQAGADTRQAGADPTDPPIGGDLPGGS